MAEKVPSPHAGREGNVRGRREHYGFRTEATGLEEHDGKIVGPVDPTDFRNERLDCRIVEDAEERRGHLIQRAFRHVHEFASQRRHLKEVLLGHRLTIEQWLPADRFRVDDTQRFVEHFRFGNEQLPVLVGAQLRILPAQVSLRCLGVANDGGSGPASGLVSDLGMFPDFALESEGIEEVESRPKLRPRLVRFRPPVTTRLSDTSPSASA